MRHLQVRVARGQGGQVVEIAQNHDVVDVICWEATSSDEANLDVVAIQAENRAVGSILNELEDLPRMSATLYPHEILAFEPPARRAPSKLKNLENRSPLEILLNSLQSVGSWGSFLAYVAAGAIIVWISLFTNTIYLIIAAMLIAPFAGPAMNVAMATAVGDAILFWKSLARYAAAIALSVAIAAALTFLFHQTVFTDLMIGVGQVSAVAALLPLIAGAAGALNLVQSERSSLVPGAAVGMLVAAALAPPAGLMGMALVMGRWEVVLSTGFLLILQLVGINLGGAIVFRHYGITSDLTRYERGKQALFYVSLAATALALVGLLAWQFSGQFRLQRSSEGTRAAQTIEQVVKASNLAELVDVQAGFQQGDEEQEDTLLATVWVKRQADVEPDDEIARALRVDIQQRLQETQPGALPLVNVVVLEPPAGW
ncbi:MAG TPA: DUF389 domain-containing protein [Anaerolineae bacterium]|nr:DUF389 domain-containing protein [Anaerolineae bacterium]